MKGFVSLIGKMPASKSGVAGSSPAHRTMKYEYQAVIVTSMDGQWYGADRLNNLLLEGWEPMRETPNNPLSNVSISHWFCVLRREKKS